jgi:RNA polymerase sigma factor (sigma-70 family)
LDLSRDDGDRIDAPRIDPKVVSALYVEHGEELRAFLAGVLRNADLAAEALQSTFSKAVEVGHTAREESLKGWLFRVAYHEAMLLKRRQGVHSRSLVKLASIGEEAPKSPEEVLFQEESADRVRRALERLPKEHRVIVHKKIYEEKTFAMIAAELKLPLGTVLTRMRAALKNLRESFGDE